VRVCTFANVYVDVCEWIRERICVNKCSGCKGVDVNVYSIMISILRLFVAKAKVIEMY